MTDDFSKLKEMKYSNLDKLPKFVGDDTSGLYDLKVLPTGRVIAQKPYLTSIKSASDLVLDPMVNGKVVDRNPTERELEDMLTAWYVNRKMLRAFLYQKNFLKNRLLYPEGWSLIGDFSDVEVFDKPRTLVRGTLRAQQKSRIFVPSKYEIF